MEMVRKKGCTYVLGQGCEVRDRTKKVRLVLLHTPPLVLWKWLNLFNHFQTQTKDNLIQRLLQYISKNILVSFWIYAKCIFNPWITSLPDKYRINFPSNFFYSNIIRGGIETIYPSKILGFIKKLIIY